MERMPSCVADRLSRTEQRVLQRFYAGRLPAGQLHAELARAREPVGETRRTFPGPLLAAPAAIEAQVPAAA